jgi:hypothetical protein
MVAPIRTSHERIRCKGMPEIDQPRSGPIRLTWEASRRKQFSECPVDGLATHAPAPHRDKQMIIESDELTAFD